MKRFDSPSSLHYVASSYPLQQATSLSTQLDARLVSSPARWLPLTVSLKVGLRFSLPAAPFAAGIHHE
jgi:hypothetical protein